MGNRKKWWVVAEKIEEVLQNGLPVDSDVKHYIDSTFLNPSLEELKEILGDDSNPDGETLTELLFFPDDFVKAQIESVLENEALNKDAVDEMLARLGLEKRNVAFRFTDEQGPLRVDMPASALRQFVSRLHLLRPLNPEVAAAVDCHVDQGLRNRVKVKLRNRRGELSENQKVFLCLFFEKMRSRSRMFMPCVAFVLGFLDEIKSEKDMFVELINRKKFYFRNLQKAEQFEKRLKQSNMEILMMQGVRAAFINSAEAREKMEMIDSICRALFGKTEYFTPVSQSLDVGAFEPGGTPDDMIEDIIKKLS